MDPLNSLLKEMTDWLINDSEKICEKYGLDKTKVKQMAETMSYEEFSNALDKMVEEKKEAIN